MQIITTNTVVNTTGYTLQLERGPVIRRVNVIHQHVNHPVIVQQPRIEDFNALVIVHNVVEYFS